MEIKLCPRLGEKGLYATKFYPKSSVVFLLNGKIFEHPTKYTIHIGNNKHIHDPQGIYMNHSFTPTTKIIGRNVIAINDINIGDEITFNYNVSEINMASPFYADGQLVSGSKI